MFSRENPSTDRTHADLIRDPINGSHGINGSQAPSGRLDNHEMIQCCVPCLISLY